MTLQKKEDEDKKKKEVHWKKDENCLLILDLQYSR